MSENPPMFMQELEAELKKAEEKIKTVPAQWEGLGDNEAIAAQLPKIREKDWNEMIPSGFSEIPFNADMPKGKFMQSLFPFLSLDVGHRWALGGIGNYSSDEWIPKEEIQAYAKHIEQFLGMKNIAIPYTDLYGEQRTYFGKIEDFLDEDFTDAIHYLADWNFENHFDVKTCDNLRHQIFPSEYHDMQREEKVEFAHVDVPMTLFALKCKFVQPQQLQEELARCQSSAANDSSIRQELSQNFLKYWKDFLVQTRLRPNKAESLMHLLGELDNDTLYDFSLFSNALIEKGADLLLPAEVLITQKCENIGETMPKFKKCAILKKAIAEAHEFETEEAKILK